MFIFKRKPSLSEADLESLKRFIAKTIEVTISTKEETIHVMESDNLVLLFSWSSEYLEGSIYQLSKFQLSKTGSSTIINTPLFSELHYFNKKTDSIEYIDDNEIKNMTRTQLHSFYSMCELIRTFEVEANSAQQYRCKWD